MLVSVGRPLAAGSDTEQPGEETDGWGAGALKREILNPPYQGGKATEAMRLGISLSCEASKAYKLRRLERQLIRVPYR